MNQSYQVAEQTARRLGATCLAVPHEPAYRAAVERDFPGSYFANATAWTLEHGYRSYVEDVFFATPEGKQINRPDTMALIDCDINSLYDRLDSGIPFMIVNPFANRGHAKYLIEHPWQLERVMRFCEDNPAQDWRNRLHYREYIRTPSDHYTHFRAIVSSNGTILAAGLNYSHHTKDGPPMVISNDRFGEVDNLTLQAKGAFESPRSPYYLDSRDVRSNASSEGMSIIPLMGPCANRPLTQTETEILIAHGIDPYNRRLPPHIEAMYVTIGAYMRPALDIVTGIDIVQEADTGRGFYLERNTDPGGTMYAACGFSADKLSALTDMRLAAVTSLEHADLSRITYLNKCPAYDADTLDWRSTAEDNPIKVAAIPGSGWVVVRFGTYDLPLSPVLWKQFLKDMKAGRYDEVLEIMAENKQHSLVIGSCPGCEQTDPWARFAHQQFQMQAAA